MRHVLSSAFMSMSMGCACRACVSRLHSPAHPPLVRTWQPHLHCRRPLCLSLRMRAGRRVEVEGGGAPTCRRARVWVNEARQGSGGRWQWHGADPAVYRELPAARASILGERAGGTAEQPAVQPLILPRRNLHKFTLLHMYVCTHTHRRPLPLVSPSRWTRSCLVSSRL